MEPDKGKKLEEKKLPGHDLINRPFLLPTTIDSETHCGEDIQGHFIHAQISCTQSL